MKKKDLRTYMLNKIDNYYTSIKRVDKPQYRNYTNHELKLTIYMHNLLDNILRVEFDEPIITLHSDSCETVEFS